MTKNILSFQEIDYQEKLQKIMHEERGSKQNIGQTVKDILEDVKQRGHEAVLHYTQKFDNPKAVWQDIFVSAQDLVAAEQACSDELKLALQHAARRIRAFHTRQMPVPDYYQDDIGMYLGVRYTPVDAAGVYIPGGAASYPSSVLMNVIPAVVAGVKRIVAVVPAPMGSVNPAVLYALSLAGATEIYKIGGAQAIAALAYGVQDIAPVDKITGPGNAYVAEAKKQVYGTVGIDSIAGPSEILILADDSANAKVIAADLLSQAEHDKLAQSICISPCKKLLESVALEVDHFLETLPRQEIAKTSWEHYGVLIHAENMKMACDISNQFAPEHLEICTDNPELLLPDITHAGAIFMGHYTPEVLGDYLAGPNHVLPTEKTCRFSSGLSTTDFMKRSTLMHADSKSFRALAHDAIILAQTEGLDAHALSVQVRLETLD